MTKLLKRAICLVCGITHSVSSWRVGKVMGSMIGPNRVIANDVKSCTYWLLCQMREINSLSMVNALAIKRRNSVQYTNGLNLGYYQPSREVLIVYLSRTYGRTDPNHRNALKARPGNSIFNFTFVGRNM